MTHEVGQDPQTTGPLSGSAHTVSSTTPPGYGSTPDAPAPGSATRGEQTGSPAWTGETVPGPAVQPPSITELARADAYAISYLLAFVAATALLLYLSTSGADAIAVQAALLGFVAVATLWVRVQYVDGLDGRQWVIPGTVAVIMLAIGLVLGFTWWRTGRSGFGAAGLTLLWLAASALITRMRDTQSRGEDGLVAGLFEWTGKRRGRLGTLFTVVGLLLVLWGCLILGTPFGGGSNLTVVFVVVGLGVLMPVGVALLSEAALTTVETPNSPFVTPQGGLTQRVWDWLRLHLSTSVKAWLTSFWRGLTKLAKPLPLMVGGTVVFVAAALTGSALGGTWLLLVVFAALLSIVIALVSSTHADAVILIAIVALLGVTPHQEGRLGVTATSGTHPNGLKTLVAIGDSYMSGEGASVYFAGTDDAKVNECRRAPTAWAALAADNGYQAMDFLACSGARTGEVLLPASDPEVPADPAARAFAGALDKRGLIAPQDAGDGLSQLEKWRKDQQTRNLRPELVVVSLGGNDAGFSTIGVMCLAPGSCADKAQQDLWLGALPQVRDQLRLTYAEIDQLFAGVPVLTVGYPDPIYESNDDCGEVALTGAERQFIHEFLTGTATRSGLNDVIEQTSAEFGFHYVDTMQEALKGQNLQLCDPGNDGRPGLNFIGLRSVRGAAEQRFNPANWLHGSLHPNERGHGAMLRAYQTWLTRETATAPLSARVQIGPQTQKRLNSTRTSWLRKADSQAEKTVNSAPPCDLFAGDSTGCRPQGTMWALGQVRHVLVDHGGLAFGLIAAIGAWCAAVGFFASRRIRWDAGGEGP